MPRKNCYLTVCSLVSRLGKQAVSSGAIKRPVEIALSFLGVCFFKTKSQYFDKFLITLFLKNGQVLYSFKNKAYLKPCLSLKGALQPALHAHKAAVKLEIKCIKISQC